MFAPHITDITLNSGAFGPNHQQMLWNPQSAYRAQQQQHQVKVAQIQGFFNMPGMPLAKATPLAPTFKSERAVISEDMTDDQVIDDIISSADLSTLPSMPGHDDGIGPLMGHDMTLMVPMNGKANGKAYGCGDAPRFTGASNIQQYNSSSLERMWLDETSSWGKKSKTDGHEAPSAQERRGRNTCKTDYFEVPHTPTMPP